MAGMRLAGKVLVHQVCPVKIGADVTASVMPDVLLWKAHPKAAIVVRVVLPVVGSAAVLSLADLDALAMTRRGQYVLAHMPPSAPAARLADDALMGLGACRHSPALLARRRRCHHGRLVTCRMAANASPGMTITAGRALFPACGRSGCVTGRSGAMISPQLAGGGLVPDDDTLSPGDFDEVFALVSGASRTNELFGQVLGPFPAGVEPFSLVPRAGLDRVLAELRLGPGDRVVDLCCGRGGIGLWFASVSGARLTGVDFSPRAIAEASRRAGLFVPRPQASFIVADAGGTSLPAKTADAIMCIDALQLVSGKDGLLREVARILRPGGRAVITTWERNSTGPADLPPPYSIADVSTLAVAAGLRVLAREERDDWLEQERAFYQRVIAEDSDQAEPALRLLAEEARDLLPYSASVRRLLLVASV